MYDFFSPEVRIQIGTCTIEKHIILELRLDDTKNFDWAVITFTVDLLSDLGIAKGDRTSIQLGYQGVFEEVFVGDVINLKDNQAFIRNDFIKLARIPIRQSFVKCTPQEVVGFILSKVGITKSQLSSDPYPVKELLSIGNQTGLEALRYIDQKWGIEHSTYFFRGETFEWNIPIEQDKFYEFSYGENILDLQNICPKVWELTTISVPMIKVLHEIEINHPKITGTFKVHAVTFYVNDYGFVRTKLTFKEEE